MDLGDSWGFGPFVFAGGGGWRATALRINDFLPEIQFGNCETERKRVSVREEGGARTAGKSLAEH